MAFLIFCEDREDGQELRLSQREAHLSYVRRFGGHVQLAGTVLDDADAGTSGSVYILDFDRPADAHAFVDGDPYVKAGLFRTVRIRSFQKSPELSPSGGLHPAGAVGERRRRPGASGYGFTFTRNES